MTAIERNNHRRVCEMARSVKDINALYMGNTPLSLACKKGSKETVKCLLDEGSDVKVKDGSYRAPIISAFDNKDYKNIVMILINAGADLSVEDSRFRTPLVCAVDKYALGDRKDAMELIVMLLEKGVYANHINERMYTPLMETSQMGDRDLVNILLQYGADVNFQNKDTMTPLKAAKSDEIVEILKTSGAVR